MATLLDYTSAEFPHHTVEVWQRDGWSMPIRRDAGSDSPPSGSGSHRDAADPPDTPDLALNDHTVVAHVVGAQAAIELLERLRSAGWHDSAAVLVCPARPSVVPHGGEDTESVTDLPDRRVIGASVIGAVVAALLGAAAGWVLGDEVATGVVSGGFAAVLGAVVGAMLGGLGRHAGDRAWSQPHVPGRTMGVVATFAPDAAVAQRVVRAMERADPHDIRLVRSNGSWRLPLG